MEDKLNQILKSLKSIAPEEGFVSRSRALLDSASQHGRGWFVFRGPILQSIKLGMAVSLASGLLFIVLGGVSFFNIRNLSPVMLSSINKANIQSEADNMDFQVQLGEAKYDVNADKAVGLKIDALLKDLSL